MSREELGDTIAEVATRTTILAARPATPDGTAAERATTTTSAGIVPSRHPAGGPPDVQPDVQPDDQADDQAHDRPRRTMLAGTAAALLALSGTLGWIGATVWSGTPGSTAPNGPAAWAVAVDVQPRGESAGRMLVEVGLRVTDLDAEPVTLTGAETTFDAGAIEAVVPDSQVIQPGASAEVVARGAVSCRSPQPLRLYPLQVRRADHSLSTIPVSGDTAALAAACAGQGPQTQVLALTSVAPDGNRLAVVLRSPTGRTTEVLAVHAGGVQLSGRPLGDFDGHDRTLWLDPPQTCPPPWSAGGLPRVLSVQVDAGGPATVDLDVGYPLARWIRAGPCAAGGG